MTTTQPTIIRIVDVIEGSICVDAQDGEKVFEVIKKHLKMNEHVTLSFEGVEFVISAFLNVAIGKLYGVFTEEEIKNRFSVDEKMKQEDVIKLKRAIENGKAFYKNPDVHTRIFLESVDEA